MTLIQRFEWQKIVPELISVNTIKTYDYYPSNDIKKAIALVEI